MVLTIPKKKEGFQNASLGADDLSAIKNLGTIAGGLIKGGYTVPGDLNIAGNSAITGNSTIKGNFVLTGNSAITGDTNQSGNSSITGNLTVGGTIGGININKGTNTPDQTKIQWGDGTGWRVRFQQSDAKPVLDIYDNQKVDITGSLFVNNLIATPQVFRLANFQCGFFYMQALPSGKIGGFAKVANSNNNDPSLYWYWNGGHLISAKYNTCLTLLSEINNGNNVVSLSPIGISPMGPEYQIWNQLNEYYITTCARNASAKTTATPPSWDSQLYFDCNTKNPFLWHEWVGDARCRWYKT